MEDYPQRYKITEIYLHERRTSVNSFRSLSFHPILPPLPTLLMALKGGLQGGYPSLGKIRRKTALFLPLDRRTSDPSQSRL